jgi:hypothetical protein
MTGNVEIFYSLILEICFVESSFGEENCFLSSINVILTVVGYCDPLLMWNKANQ